MKFQGIINARDLGGISVGGKTIRPGRLLRTAHLSDATDDDIRTLSEEYRLKRIFDFRSVVEAEGQPDRPVPGAEHIFLPTLDLEAEKRSGDAVPEETFLDLPKHIARLSFMDIFKRKARDLYPSLVLSEFSQLQYASFLNLILETPEGAVLWHCSQGKDRTGMGAAYILGALGADRETIVADFDASNTVYRPLVDKLCLEVEALGGGEEEKDVIRAFMGVSVRNFCNTLDLIDREWGSLQSYLTGLLGLTSADFQTLRERYLF